MNKKKQYMAPVIKCVEFKVEQGFASSGLTQKTIQLDEWSRRDSYDPMNPFHVSFGSFGNNNDDWD